MSTPNTATARTKRPTSIAPAKKPPSPPKKAETMTIPKAADLLYTTRQERLELQKQVEDLAEKEKSYREFIINNLPKDSSGAAGLVALATIVTKSTPVVKDWGKFYAYVSRTKRWELLQKRLGTKAVTEIWDTGREVPGVEAFTFKDVSLSKVK